MSSTYIPAELRRLVVERAEATCEYCLIGEAETFFGCEILRFNDPERILERKALYEVGRYPSPAARRRMNREAQR